MTPLSQDGILEGVTMDFAAGLSVNCPSVAVRAEPSSCLLRFHPLTTPNPTSRPLYSSHPLQHLRSLPPSITCSHSTLVSTAFTRPRDCKCIPRHPRGFVDVSLNRIHPDFAQVNAPVTRSTSPAAHSASPRADDTSQTSGSSNRQRRDSGWWCQSQFRCLS